MSAVDAIWTALQAEPLTANRVYRDAPPADASVPLVVIGGPVERQRLDLTGTIARVSYGIRVMASAEGDSATVDEIAERIATIFAFGTVAGMSASSAGPVEAPEDPEHYGRQVLVSLIEEQ